MKWTRRNFLSTTVAASGLISTIEASPNRVDALSTGERKTLQTAMDEIIPASDGMPAASEAGGMGYLNGLAQQEEAIANEIRLSLAALNEASQKSSGKSFGDLGQPERVAALSELEKASPPRFATLRDFVYEAYYTQPKIWSLIGYEFYPTDHAGPHMPPFDDSILAEVLKKPKFYREA